MASKPVPALRQRRGRPSKAGTQQLDRRILDAAWQTFLDVGYEGASMDMLAKQAGVTRNTLYARHADKLALLRATVADRIARWSRASSAIAKPAGAVDGTLEDRLITFATTVLIWSGHPEILGTARLVRGSNGEAGEIARELDRTIRESGLRDLARMIEKGCAAADWPVSNPQTVARLLMGMLEAFAPTDERAALTHERAETIARQAVAVLMRGREAW
jgi:TetR/AcrR family transcriptional regulator, mexJK operon transcriptional repressor